jgi:dienelactone hydrolase
MQTAALLLALLFAQSEKVESGSSPCRALRPAADPALQEFLKPYEFADKEFAWKLQELKAADKFDVSWLTFPSAIQGDIPENNTVWAKFWQPKDDAKKRPAALVLHWLGGSFSALETVCQRLAEQGIPALMMYMPHYGPRRSKEPGRVERLFGEDMEKTLIHIRQTVLDARRAGDWLAARPDIDPARVGIVGISLGAIMGSLAAGVDDRFGRSVFIIGGGDLPAIVLHGSKETAAQRKRLEEAGYTVEKLRDAWKGIEPLTFASRLKAENVLMINADADEVIPKASTEKLRDAIGKPEVKWFKGGHYAIILQFGPVVRDVAAHLKPAPAEEKK